MTPELIIIDGNYLGHRAHHTTGQLSAGDVRTGVTFGFLATLLALGEKFRCNHFAFCWDSKHSLRRDIYPAYKANRRTDKTPEEEEESRIARSQFKKLRKWILPIIGFPNQFLKRGLEADDLIASICHNKLGEFLIVSADHDLFQLLANNVSQYNPASQRMMTSRSFREETGIGPSQWPMVKAIAGCKTDNVQGVSGIGEKTAIKYLRGELKKTSAKYRCITTEGPHVVHRNEVLVTLPFRSVELDLKQEVYSPRDFTSVCNKFGFESFLREEKRWENFFAGRWEEVILDDINERIRKHREDKRDMVNR